MLAQCNFARRDVSAKRIGLLVIRTSPNNHMGLSRPQSIFAYIISLVRGFRWPWGKCPLWSPRPWLVHVMISFLRELKGLVHCDYCWQARCDKVSVLGLCSKGGRQVTFTNLLLEAPLFRIRLCHGYNFYERIGRKPKPSEVRELCLGVAMDL